MYIYTSYSPFEEIVNRYMTYGLPIEPIVSMDHVHSVDNSSFVSLTNITQPDLRLPVDTSVLRNITLLDSQ